MNKTAYIYRIKIDGIIRYIGKGRGKRYLRHEQIARSLNAGQRIKATPFQKKLAKALCEDRPISSEIYLSDLTDEEAFQQEEYEIESRRADLWNVLDGGEGMSSVNARAVWVDVEKRKRRSLLTRARWADVKSIYRNVPDRLRNQAFSAAKTRWANPKNREIAAARMRVRWANPEYRNRQIAAARARCSDPKIKEQLTARSRAYRAAVKAGED